MFDFRVVGMLLEIALVRRPGVVAPADDVRQLAEAYHICASHGRELGRPLLADERGQNLIPIAQAGRQRGQRFGGEGW